MATRKAVARQGSLRQKWMPKGASREAAGEEESAETSTRHEGPFYDRGALLAALQAYPGGGEEQKLPITVMERPAEEEEEEEEPARISREALREAARAKKLAKRSSTTSLDGAGESPAMAYDPAAMAQFYGAMPQMAYGMYTTVMLRNIPNRYTRDMLVERLQKGYAASYDFVYLPVDFNSEYNMGYAFINFTEPAAASRFMAEFHGAKTESVLPGFSSPKVCEVTYARVQGRDANLENLCSAKFVDKLSERPAWQPLFIGDDGQAIPFSKTAVMAKRNKRGLGGMMDGPAARPGVSLATAVPGATAETMMMLKNIPQKLSRTALIEALDKRFKGAYSFLYAPEDPKRPGANRGHCFLNLRTAEKVREFTEAFHKKSVKECFGVESPHECEVVAARWESIERSIERLSKPQRKGKDDGSAQQDSKEKGEEKENGQEASTAANNEEAGQAPEQKEAAPREEGADRTAWHPVLFSLEGDTEPFPMPSAIGGGEAPPTSKGGKGKGKGKHAATAGYGYPYDYYAYDPHYMAAYAAAYQQAAHAHAHAVATANAGQGSMLESMAAAMKTMPSRAKPLSEDAKRSVVNQVEFYFSDDNMCKDVYLRRHMDAEGWISLDLISQFNKLKAYRTTVLSIVEALQASTKLEVDANSRRVRLKDESLRSKWTKASQELVEASSPKAGTLAATAAA